MLAWGSRGWGGGGSLSARRTVGSHHYAQHWPAPAMHGCNTAQQRRSRTTLVCMAKKTYYEVLGVTSTASMKDIKSAYRKAALKLHPDVNNAPDAKERFMEAKAAFETLTDDKKRAEYDRRLRMGFGTQGFDSKSYSSRSSTSSSGSYGYSGTRTRPSTPPQDDYSFDDLLRDLDKEFREWNASRASKPGAGNKSSSLWEELESIGEELVDFLEETIGVSDAEDDKDKGAKAKGPASKDESAGGQRSGTKADKGTQTTDYTNSDFYKKYEEPLRQATGGSYQEPPKQAPKKPPEQEIDDMLAELKKKYNRK